MKSIVPGGESRNVQLVLMRINAYYGASIVFN